LGNHDKSRIASRVGAVQARNAAMLLFSLPGTLTMYYGEELGMADVPIPPEKVQDPAEKNEPGIGVGRDPERTPMPWDGSPLGGFTECNPWLPLGEEHLQVNVENLKHDPRSMYALYRKLIQLRRNHPALVNGKIEAVEADGHLLRFTRTSEGDSLVVGLNLGTEAVPISVPSAVVIACTGMDREGEAVRGHINLQGGEGLIMKIEA
jgi:alpha-glucosidase